MIHSLQVMITSNFQFLGKSVLIVVVLSIRMKWKPSVNHYGISNNSNNLHRLQIQQRNHQLPSTEMATSQELIKRLYAGFGREKLMWGTDWPIARERATYAQRLTVVRDEMKFLSNEDKRWILSKTVAEVWPKLGR